MLGNVNDISRNFNPNFFENILVLKSSKKIIAIGVGILISIGEEQPVVCF